MLWARVVLKIESVAVPVVSLFSLKKKVGGETHWFVVVVVAVFFVFPGGQGLKLDLAENLISVVVLFCILFFFIAAMFFGSPQLVFKRWLAWVCIGMYVAYIVYVIVEDVTRKSMHV